MYIQCLWTIYLKHEEEYRNLNKKDIEDINESKLDKAWFQRGISNGDFKDLPI